MSIKNLRPDQVYSLLVILLMLCLFACAKAITDDEVKDPPKDTLVCYVGNISGKGVVKYTVGKDNVHGVSINRDGAVIKMSKDYSKAIYYSHGVPCVWEKNR